jgi:hypothetical protein
MITCARASAANEPTRLSPTERSLAPSCGSASLLSSTASAGRNFAVPVGNVSAASAGKINDLTAGKVFGGEFLSSRPQNFIPAGRCLRFFRLRFSSARQHPSARVGPPGRWLGDQQSSMKHAAIPNAGRAEWPPCRVSSGSMAPPGKFVPPEPSRAERLAAALRENLKRRKAQARAKQGAAKTESQPKSPSR